MAIDPPLVSSPTPSFKRAAKVDIGHVQLRDVLICPRRRGVLNYVKGNSIVECDLQNPYSSPRTLVKLLFQPTTVSALPLDSGSEHTLIAAGGMTGDLHLSLHCPTSPAMKSKPVWRFDDQLGRSINNSILLTSLSLTGSNESRVEPRMVVSNNDNVVQFFDVPIRSSPAEIRQTGAVSFNVPINHSSISPDGRTMLSVGDSSKVFLHRLTGGASVTAAPIATLALPPLSDPSVSPALVACFSSAFSSDGSKYAVASQDGSVIVWDVRSTRPLKVFRTNKSRPTPHGAWYSEDPQDWNSANTPGPGWSTRSVKFGGPPGRELMLFTEHTSLIHVVDARTFETEEILCMPQFTEKRSPQQFSPPSLTPSFPATRARSPYAHRHYDVRSTLEETFRIPSADDILLIPHLGDPSVERDLQMVLGPGLIPEDGIFARSSELPLPEMEVMREECSRTPFPDCSGPPGPVDHCDIAGACFDPSGAHIYAASVHGVAEWGVRGANKRWWVDSDDWQR
ncbi:unnamed protein product [Mycena citricolor]|uniref:DUF2415 domain-containing protein n=1 Tax=Mycena citricolor TaxID=2018698 RepID=A0AAD2Q4R0_9AGAR|nr:unnamed protein product [Mycena citricolor]